MRNPRIHRHAILIAALAALLCVNAPFTSAQSAETTSTAAPTIAAGGVHLPVPYMRQPDDQTCLPTCLTMALHFMGRVELTSPTVFAFHKRTNYDRYNLPPMLREYGLYGFPSWYERNWTRKTVEKELDAGRPVILGCNQGRYGHFVLAVGYTGDGRLIINDPSIRKPGYEIGGPHSTIRWEQLLWRGGCIIRPDEFAGTPRLSGTCTESTAPRRMTPGETAEALFEVKNNGADPWPAEVYLAPVEPESSPTQFRRSALMDGEKWISPERAAAPDRKAIAPGEKALFRVPLRAPQTEAPAIFMERWNLVDSTGRRLGDSFLAGPGDYQMFSKVVVELKRAFDLPLVETAKDGGRRWHG